MNGDLRPSDVSSKSTAVVWWVCDANPPHVWQAAVRGRRAGDRPEMALDQEW